MNHLHIGLSRQVDTKLCSTLQALRIKIVRNTIYHVAVIRDDFIRRLVLERNIFRLHTLSILKLSKEGFEQGNSAVRFMCSTQVVSY